MYVDGSIVFDQDYRSVRFLSREGAVFCFPSLFICPLMITGYVLLYPCALVVHLLHSLMYHTHAERKRKKNNIFDYPSGDNIHHTGTLKGKKKIVYTCLMLVLSVKSVRI